YRPVTTLGEWLEAFSEQRSRPTPAQVFRHGSMSSLRSGMITWTLDDFSDGVLPDPDRNLEVFYRDWCTMVETKSDVYRDTHCWVFTPAVFSLLIEDLRHVGLLDLELLEVYGQNNHEFFVHMRKPGKPATNEDQSMFYERRAKIMREMVRELAAFAAIFPEDRPDPPHETPAPTCGGSAAVPVGHGPPSATFPT